MAKTEDHWPQIRPQILRAIVEQGSQAPPPGRVWRIGNLKQYPEGFIYFRIGKSRSIRVPTRNEKGFDSANIESSPWTHVLLDPDAELCAIAHNTDLARSSASVAVSIGKILNATAKRMAINPQLMEVEVTPIIDPESMLKSVQDAYQLTGLRITFRRPNAFDVDADFVRPAQKMTELLDARSGAVSFQGEDLRRDDVERVVRSVAATGDDAQIAVRMRKADRIIKKNLHQDNPAVFDIGDDTFPAELENCGIVMRMKSLYSRIRQSLGPHRGGGERSLPEEENT